MTMESVEVPVMHASISRVIRRSVLAGLVSVSLASAGGCFLVAAGAVGAAGGGAYTEGRERRVYAVRIDDAWPAVKAAVDQLGCGDALLTTVALARAGGAGAQASALLGAVAASVQAGRMGNLPVSATDLRRSIARLHSANLTFASADVVEAAGGVRRVS